MKSKDPYSSTLLYLNHRTLGKPSPYPIGSTYSLGVLRLRLSIRKRMESFRSG